MKTTSRERQLAAHQLIEASKKPYLVRDMPRKVLYLTADQAAKRQDLIPQFGLWPPIVNESLLMFTDLTITLFAGFNEVGLPKGSQLGVIETDGYEVYPYEPSEV